MRVLLVEAHVVPFDVELQVAFCIPALDLHDDSVAKSMLLESLPGFGGPFFNLLGPLANPVRCRQQVIGVFSSEYAVKMAEVLNHLGSKHVLIVAGSDGLDEITITGQTKVVEVKDGKISSYTIAPEDFDMNRGHLKDIQVTTSMQSAQLIRQIFQNKASDSAKNIVALNAGAALYVSGICSSLENGVRQAIHLIESKTAYQMLLDLKKEGVSEHVN